MEYQRSSVQDGKLEKEKIDCFRKMAARAAGWVAIDCPYVAFQDMEGYKKSKEK